MLLLSRRSLTAAMRAGSLKAVAAMPFHFYRSNAAFDSAFKA